MNSVIFEGSKNLIGKTVQIRADLNLPINNGKILDKTRLLSIARTVKELQKTQCKISILSHFGRPKGKFIKKMSLKPIIPEIEKTLKTKIIFSKSCIGNDAENSIKKVQNGGVAVMENTRFHRGEENNFNYFAKEISKYSDYFVNDAFSVAHRSHASVTGLTKYLPSFAGRSFEEEVLTIDKFLGSKNKRKLAIIGGSKISTKISLINNLIKKVNSIVIGGAMANTFLSAQDKEIGKSLHEKSKDLQELSVDHFNTQELLIKNLNKFISKNDVLYIKGSRGMKMEKIIKGLK